MVVLVSLDSWQFQNSSSLALVNFFVAIMVKTSFNEDFKAGDSFVDLCRESLPSMRDHRR